MIIAKFEVPALRVEVSRSPTGYLVEWARRTPELSVYLLPFPTLELAMDEFWALVEGELGARREAAA